MSRSIAERHRRNRKRNAERKIWYQVYRQRIIDELEHCRNCNTGMPLTFDHIIPHCRDGRLTFDNTTILCKACNEEKADQEWPHLKSLSAEEAAAPADRRWTRRMVHEMEPLTYHPFRTLIGYEAVSI